MACQGPPPAPLVNSASCIDFPPHLSSSAHLPTPYAPPLATCALSTTHILPCLVAPCPPSSMLLSEPPLPPRCSAGVVCLLSLNLLKKRLTAGQLGNNGDDGNSDGAKVTTTTMTTTIKTAMTTTTMTTMARRKMSSSASWIAWP